MTDVAEAKAETTPRVPFSVEHVRAVCGDALLPPDVPADTLRWGFRLNKPDFTSSRDFRWPFPGNWAMARGPFTVGLHADDACPSSPGDGLMVALSIRGAQSGLSWWAHSVGLLVAFVPDDVLAGTEHKVRCRRVWVADAFDPTGTLLAAHATGANLRGANLGGADLWGATFSAATVWPANVDPIGRGAVKW